MHLLSLQRSLIIYGTLHAKVYVIRSRREEFAMIASVFTDTKREIRLVLERFKHGRPYRAIWMPSQVDFLILDCTR